MSKSNSSFLLSLSEIVKNCLVLAILNCFITNLHAQNNFFVGFNTSYTSATTNNDIVQKYNDNNSFEQEFADLHWLYGLNLGIRKRFGASSISLSWTNVQKKREAFAEDPPGTLLKEDLRYSFNTYEIGLSTHIKAFSYGISIGRRRSSINTRIGSSDKNKNLVKDSNWVSKFHIELTNVGSDYNSIAIRPYVEYAWTETDLAGLNGQLLGSSDSLLDRFHMFGISIIFYNGNQ